ncbi:hypothetical protein [Streptomyces cavernicola]|uniref:DUF2637 domain-containing protein n=1 Tax=Streptomyces cavernicola TaxID=3043613 RepID=A0ABT6SK86_9ACTN|nr:hypothetical protein [Streptomyces sp. B-S-A6]MDI3408319.1 hypothetical protein [Streptomyces sp. B-S-A6]
MALTTETGTPRTDEQPAPTPEPAQPSWAEKRAARKAAKTARKQEREREKTARAPKSRTAQPKTARPRPDSGTTPRKRTGTGTPARKRATTGTPTGTAAQGGHNLLVREMVAEQMRTTTATIYRVITYVSLGVLLAVSFAFAAVQVKILREYFPEDFAQVAAWTVPIALQVLVMAAELILLSSAVTESRWVQGVAGAIMTTGYGAEVTAHIHMGEAGIVTVAMVVMSVLLGLCWTLFALSLRAGIADADALVLHQRGETGTDETGSGTEGDAECAETGTKNRRPRRAETETGTGGGTPSGTESGAAARHTPETGTASGTPNRHTGTPAQPRTGTPAQPAPKSGTPNGTAAQQEPATGTTGGTAAQSAPGSPAGGTDATEDPEAVAARLTPGERLSTIELDMLVTVLISAGADTYNEVNRRFRDMGHKAGSERLRAAYDRVTAVDGPADGETEQNSQEDQDEDDQEDDRAA